MSITCLEYFLKLSSRASLKATAFAAIRFSCGHPWTQGKTALAILGQNSSFDIIIAPLGHLNVLCVVVVTISQYETGFSKTPQAINHAMCAISAISTAQTLSAISLNLFQSRFLE